MEAMACGLPVICSDIRGNRDLIIDGKGGYLVNPNDVEGFAEKIRYAMYDEEFRRNCGLFNLRRIDDFNEEKVLNILEDIYVHYK